MQGRHLLAPVGTKTFKLTTGPVNTKLTGQISLDSSTGFTYEPDYSIAASLDGPDGGLFVDISYAATATFTYTTTVTVSADAQVRACRAAPRMPAACAKPASGHASSCTVCTRLSCPCLTGYAKESCACRSQPAL